MPNLKKIIREKVNIYFKFISHKKEVNIEEELKKLEEYLEGKQYNVMINHYRNSLGYVEIILYQNDFHNHIRVSGWGCEYICAPMLLHDASLFIYHNLSSNSTPNMITLQSKCRSFSVKALGFKIEHES